MTLTDKVGRARKLSGTLLKMTRTGNPSSRNTSMRWPIFKTTPLLVASTCACSRVSTPVAGLTRTMVISWPTAFSMSFAGVSKSKSKFCSTMLMSGAAKDTVSGRICADTSWNSIRCLPSLTSMSRRS
jgi:hypothetical protein